MAAQNSLSMSAGGTGAPEAAAQSAPGATDAGMLGLPAAGAGAGSSLTLGRGVAQVWGRKAAEPPPPPSPQPAPTSTTPAKEEAATHSPAATPAPVTAASPVLNQPHVPTEKEKMAAALFGGFGGGAAGSTTSSSAGRRGSAAATAATRRSSSGATPAAAGKPSTPPVRSASVASPTTTAPAAPASSANMFDLLDMAPAPSSQSTPVVTPLASHAGPDLFGDMLVPAAKTACDSSSSSPAPSGAAPAPPANVFDAFADMTIDDKGAPPAQSGPTGPAYNPIRLSTAEFGGKWGQTPSESRRVFRLSPASHNLQGFVNALQGERGISHIESIPTTNEVRGDQRHVLYVFIGDNLGHFCNHCWSVHSITTGSIGQSATDPHQAIASERRMCYYRFEMYMCSYRVVNIGCNIVRFSKILKQIAWR